MKNQHVSMLIDAYFEWFTRLRLFIILVLHVLDGVDNLLFTLFDKNWSRTGRTTRPPSSAWPNWISCHVSPMTKISL